MVFIHHVLLLLLHVLFSHTGTGVIAQHSWIIAEGDDVVLPERCPDSAEDEASSLTAKVVNGASNLTAAEDFNGTSNLSATEVINGDTDSSLTDTEVIKRNAHITSSPEILVTGPECPSHLPNKAITAEDAGLYCCQDGTNDRIHVSVLSRGSIRRSNSTISFSCMLVTAKGRGACVDPTVRLMWVDVEDNEIQNRVRRSSCNTRIFVQNEDSRVFLCQAYRGMEVKATLSFPMRPPGPGKGRRGMFGGPDPNCDSKNNYGSDVDPQSQGGNGGVAVVLVGVCCVALTALLTLFVVNSRRSSKPLPANSDNINRDLDLPVSSGVWIIMPKQEVTEYASVRTHMYDQ